MTWQHFWAKRSLATKPNIGVISKIGVFWASLNWQTAKFLCLNALNLCGFWGKLTNYGTKWAILWNTHCFSRILCACSVVPGSLWSWSGTTPEGSAWCCWRWTPQNSESALVWVLSPPLWGDCTRVEEAQTHMKAFIVKKTCIYNNCHVTWTQRFTCYWPQSPVFQRWIDESGHRCFVAAFVTSPAHAASLPPARRICRCWHRFLCRTAAQEDWTMQNRLHLPQTCHLSLTFHAAVAPSRSQT